jgi:hypothetical protein
MMICCDVCNTWFHGRCVGHLRDPRAVDMAKARINTQAHPHCHCCLCVRCIPSNREWGQTTSSIEPLERVQVDWARAAAFSFFLSTSLNLFQKTLKCPRIFSLQHVILLACTVSMRSPAGMHLLPVVFTPGITRSSTHWLHRQPPGNRRPRQPAHHYTQCKRYALNALRI